VIPARRRRATLGTGLLTVSLVFKGALLADCTIGVHLFERFSVDVAQTLLPSLFPDLVARVMSVKTIVGRF
jgi:hypothetical protein